MTKMAAMAINSKQVKQVYWYISQVSGERKQDHWSSSSEISNVCYMTSRDVRKPDFCLGENKGADQLRSNCEADQRLCFRFTDTTIPLLCISKISRF